MSNQAFGAGLLALAGLFLLAAWLQYSPALFGAFHDDTLYFSVAKAFAEGTPNVLPNLPNSPSQTKYPPLYPWLLSFVWHIQPEFPQNVAWGWGLNLFFGLGLLVAAVASLRNLGCSRKEALVLGGLFALNPHTILWTNLLLSDVLAALLTLVSVLAADHAIRNEKRSFWGWWFLAVVVACLALLTKTLNIALIAGLVLFALSKRKYLAASAASFAAAPMAVRLVRNWLAAPPTVELDGMYNGFQQNWLYYTNYIDFWKLSVPNLDVLSAQSLYTATEMLKFPAVAAFILDVEVLSGMVMQSLAVAISAAIVYGIISRGKVHGYSSVHWVFVCSLPILILWNYPLFSRFCLPFLPLILAGASLEVVRLSAMIRKSFRDSKQTDQRVASVLIGAALAALLVNATWNYLVTIPEGYHKAVVARQKILTAKEQAYAWLSDQTEPGPVISYEDGLLFLYTGVQGMRPVALSTEAFFMQNEAPLKRDIDGLADTAAALKARYWVAADDDFNLDFARRQVSEAAKALLEGSVVAFQSDDGSVRIYELETALTSVSK